MGESPRWHENRLWLADWGAREIVAVDLDGNRDVVVRTGVEFPFCIDWLPCALGGTDDSTLFLIAAEWRGMEQITEVARARTGQVLTLRAPAAGVGWP